MTEWGDECHLLKSRAGLSVSPSISSISFRFRCGFCGLHRLFEWDFFAVRIYPVNIKGSVGGKKDHAWSSARTGGAVHVVRWHVEEIAAGCHDGFITLHLSFQFAADDMAVSLGVCQ